MHLRSFGQRVDPIAQPGIGELKLSLPLLIRE
jgi:hypothetical protein